MNCLNSVIVEGTISKIEKEETKVTFILDVSRTKKNEQGTNEVEITRVPVACYGEFAERVSLFGEKGKDVRVVGRLQESKSIEVIAEHIDLKLNR